MKDLRQYITNSKPSTTEDSIFSFILRYCPHSFDIDNYKDLYIVLSEYTTDDLLAERGYGDYLHYADMGLPEDFHIQIITDALFKEIKVMETGSIPFYGDSSEEDKNIAESLKEDMKRLLGNTTAPAEKLQEILEFIDDFSCGDATIEYLFIQSEELAEMPFADDLASALGCELIDSTSMLGLYVEFNGDFYQLNYEEIMQILRDYYTPVNLPENATLIEAFNSFNWEYPIMNVLATAIKNKFQSKEEVIF